MASRDYDIGREREAQGGIEGSGRPRSPREDALSAIQMGFVCLDADAYSDAVGFFERATEVPLRDELQPSELRSLYSGLARCHIGLGEHEEALRWADELSNLDVEDPTLAAEADVLVGRIESRAGRFRESLVAARRAYKTLSRLPESPLLADAAKFMGTAHAELGNVASARDCFVDCLVTNRRLGDRAGMAGAYNNLGILAKRTGDLASAVEYFQEALAIDRDLGRTAAVARRLNNLGVALYRMSRWSEAERHLLDSLEIYVGLGATRDVVAVKLALASVFRARREWDSAREYLEWALDVSREFGYRRSEALALEFLGELAADRGHHEEALELLDRALACAYQLSASSDAVSEVLRRRAEVLLEVGRLDEAERDCAQSLELSSRLGDRLEEGAALRVLARILYARGDRSGARQRILSAEDALRRTGETFELARTYLADGVGLRESSQEGELPIERIQARLFAAEELFAGIGADYWVGLCRLERGNALKSAGRLGGARNWLGLAREAFETAGETGALGQVDRLQKEIDHDLAGAVSSSSGRYSVIAEGYRQLYESGLTVEAFHAIASRVADAVAADRLILFELADGPPQVAISYDRSGRRLAEARRVVRSAVSGQRLRKPVVLTGSEMPEGLLSAAVFPVRSPSQESGRYLLYADRLRAGDRRAFDSDDIEFMGAAARMMALLSLDRPDAIAEVRAEGDAPPGVSCEFMTRDPGLLEMLASVDRLRGSDIPILILGESGVGKDVLARAIHASSGREGRFVALNSGAVPPNLQESELFGHVKGAFTDADRDREGLVASASGGTLFLDEIGDMSPELQVKLLRFLQSGEYRRVGESVVRTSDARVISASNRDLRKEARAGAFRADLYYRLSGFVIEIPPLRARPQDIPLLMDHFLELYSEIEGRSPRGFSKEVRELFLSYDWSENNVRELENEVRRGVALCGYGELIEIEDLRPELRLLSERTGAAGGRERRDYISLKDEVEALERARIIQALAKSGNSKRKAAAELGLSRTGLYTKLQKYKLN